MKRFRTTRWSMIRSARETGDAASAEALSELCSAYWYPLYVCVRRMGHGADESRDLTQGYFLKLLDKRYLDDVRPEAGKFRSFLLASLKHHVANVRRDASAMKRGGAATTLSLDLVSAEERYGLEPVDERTPDRVYDRQWALTVLDRARSRMRAEMAAEGKAEQYDSLSGYLSGDNEGRSYRDVAEEAGTTEAAVKMTVSRMRRRFGRVLRDEVADTVGDSAEVDDEVRYLLSALR